MSVITTKLQSTINSQLFICNIYLAHFGSNQILFSLTLRQLINKLEYWLQFAQKSFTMNFTWKSMNDVINILWTVNRWYLPRDEKYSVNIGSLGLCKDYIHTVVHNKEFRYETHIFGRVLRIFLSSFKKMSQYNNWVLPHLNLCAFRDINPI